MESQVSLSQCQLGVMTTSLRVWSYSAFTHSNISSVCSAGGVLC